MSIFHSRFGERSRAQGGGGRGELVCWPRADHRAPSLPAGREAVRKACQHFAPGRAGADPRLPRPSFVSPLAHPHPTPPACSLIDLRRILASPSLCPSPSLRKRPFPRAPAPFCPLLPAGFPGKGAPWPYPTPPPPGARFGDSGKSVGPRPTPELGPPALPAPRLAHAKACCVIPTWADIPCPGRSGIGLLIILSAADPPHQPIYGPASPGWFQGVGVGSARKGGEGTVNRRVKSLAPAIGTQRKPRNLELGEGRAGMGSARQRLLREARIAGSMGFSPGLLSLGKHAGMQADAGWCNLPGPRSVVKQARCRPQNNQAGKIGIPLRMMPLRLEP